MLLLLDLNIAQQNIPNSTAAPTHHVFPKHSFLQHFQKLIFSNFFSALSRDPRGSSPTFSNSPLPATYPIIFPHLRTPFLSPSSSGTPEVSTYFHTSFFTVLYSFFNFGPKSMLGRRAPYTTVASSWHFISTY